MAATAQATRNEITLKGSVATVTEFFRHALSSILYQRGIYGPESFEPAKAYGLTVMAVKDDKLAAYLQAVLKQFSGKSLLWVLHFLPHFQLPHCPLRIRRCMWACACRSRCLTWLRPGTCALPSCPPRPCSCRRVAGGRHAAKGGAGGDGGSLQGSAGALDF